MFGFHQDELKNIFINDLMPYLFAHKHDELLFNFVVKGGLSVTADLRPILIGLRKEGSLFKISITLSVET